ncbi:MAG: glucan biosynthesis protein G [Candidatus Omnitrophica bacterium]|nr:glucan biosynthesis protein G [Candidatus Omnitrophota bacterium]
MKVVRFYQKMTVVLVWLLSFLIFSNFSFAAKEKQDKDEWSSRVRFQDIVAKAKSLSKKPFQEAGQDLPDALKKMTYDPWRSIRFKPQNSLWKNERFSLQFFHLGFLYQRPVIVNYIDQNGTHQIPFSTSLFDYAHPEIKSHLTKDLGFAGFRLHYPLNVSNYADELAVFLGASYFRALGRGQLYGMSARGLAINTAQEDGEEFPVFREFWVVHPKIRAKKIRIYALLDSNSVTGAYEFLIEPGDETKMKVNSVLFFRKHVSKMGIAPLNSMFLYGKNSGFKPDNDFRPEVHDSDGLLVHDHSGEWIWHPLVNPSRLLVNAFGGGVPKGFGLTQRDINFDHYQDLEARYDLRPSVWVEPKGNWGAGHVELVQIPMDSDYNDNIVAYWAPEQAFEPGQSVKYAYTLSWYWARHDRSPEGLVNATRIVKKADELMFVLDFTGDIFKKELKDTTPSADIWIGNGAHLSDRQLFKNTVTNGWRLVLHVHVEPVKLNAFGLPPQKSATEFRVFLKDKNSPVTETWSYTLLP